MSKVILELYDNIRSCPNLSRTSFGLPRSPTPSRGIFRVAPRRRVDIGMPVDDMEIFLKFDLSLSRNIDAARPAIIGRVLKRNIGSNMVLMSTPRRSQSPVKCGVSERTLSYIDAVGFWGGSRTKRATVSRKNSGIRRYALSRHTASRRSRTHGRREPTLCDRWQ